MKLIERAVLFGQQTAVISDNTAYTYDQLLAMSALAAAHLLDGQKDLQEARIAFLIEPGFDYTLLQWAIWRAGGIAVPLCVLHPLPSIQYVLEDTKASILIADKHHIERLNELAETLQIPLKSCEDLKKPVDTVPLPTVEQHRRAMILYTSGTTNLPKGVVTTHASISFQIATLVEAWHWRQEDHILNILPLHHVHGIINVMSCALWTGATCQFMPKFDAEMVWDCFQKGAVNVFMAVPTVYYKLIQYWKDADASTQQKMTNALRAFRLMVSGSAALPVPVLEQWKTISGQTLLERYGMTEIGMAISNPYEGERRSGHIGQALKDVQIRLVNEQGLVTKSNVPGEIQIKGPNVFLEYWNKPKATLNAFTIDGWFRSGDIALLNNGYYKILGRDSVDIIKSGGYKISALEIEDKIRKYDAVEDCAVVGIADEEWGEKIVCFYISRQDVDFNELKNFLKDSMPSYKIPKKIIRIEALPRNVLGKVTKNELKKWLEKNTSE